MVLFPFPLLLCDIGGTNARFYLCKDPPTAPKLLVNLLTAEHASWSQALHRLLRTAELKPASILVCAAGPARGRSISLTNCGWVIDGPETAREFGLSQGLLLNDFEALAFALPFLRAEETLQIGQTMAERPSEGLRLVLGPGTGLGVAGLLTSGHRYFALPSEGGHSTLPSSNPEEQEIFSLIESTAGRLTAETVLSGSGLLRLHQARRLYYKLKAEFISEPSALLQHAIGDPDGAEAETIKHFWNILADVAGNMALVTGARQGVTIAGGIMPRLAAFLDHGSFRTKFEARNPMADYCRAIPTRLILTESAPIRALHAIAANPESFALDFEQRCWN